MISIEITEQVLHGETRSVERHDNVRSQKSNTAIASLGLGASGAVRDQSKFKGPFAKQTQPAEQFEGACAKEC